MAVPKKPRAAGKRDARDEFPRTLIEVLAKHAGQQCSICKRGTVGRSYETALSVSQVGVASHITAAAPGGPRYDPSLTQDQRRSIENAIWLCGTHGRLIDVDRIRFTAERLREIKAKHESETAGALGDETDQIVDLVPARVSSALLNWPTTVGAGGTWLDRSELDGAMRVIASQKTSMQLLLGPPGAGKSALLAKLGSALQAEGKQVVAIRVDQLPKSVVDQRKFSEWAEAGTSFAATLARMSASKPTVLLVDQLDSLADLVDLQSERLNVVLDLLDAVHGTENLHIIASCRTFEFKHDARFRRLASDAIELTLPPWEAVAGILRLTGIEPQAFPETLQRLLLTPQHLKIFLEVAGDHPADYASYHAMLERLWRDRVQGDAARVRLIERLATHMAEEEVLVAPPGFADEAPLALEQLLAGGILRQSGTGIAFAHQTLFDFARARAFAAGGLALDAYVLDHQTGLFVRPVLWSALSYLREVNPAEYARVFDTLWSNASLRLHVRVLLAEFRGQVSNPSPDEIAWFGSIVDDAMIRRPVIVAMLGNNAWFKALLPTLPTLLAASYGDEFFGLLERAAPFAGAEVVALLEPCWQTTPQRSPSTLHVMRSLLCWDERAIGLIERVLRAGHVERWAVDATISAITEITPELAPRAIGVALEVGLELARQKLADFTGFGFERTHRIEEQLACAHELIELTELANAEPAKFLSAVLPPFAGITELISDPETAGPFQYPRDYGTEYGDGRLALLAEGLAKAAARVATTDPDVFVRMVARWATVETAALHRILASGLAALPVDIRVREVRNYLLADARRMALAASGEESAATVDLLKAVRDDLTQDDEHVIESAILSSHLYLDPDEQSAENRRWRLRAERRHRARLLAVLPVDKLSSDARLLLGAEPETVEEQRAPRRRHGEVGFGEIGSPMTAAQMVRADDEDIVGLFEELRDSTGLNHPKRSLGGGSVQASREFASFAKLAPERALGIVGRLVPGTQELPVAHALGALAEIGWNPSGWENLVLVCDSRGFKKEEFRWHVAHALAKRGAEQRGLSDKLCAMLERWLVEPATPDDDEDAHESPGNEAAKPPAAKNKEVVRSTSILFGPHGFEMLPSGPYPALHALFCGLMLRKPPAMERWLSILEDALSRDRSESLWTALAYDLRYLEQAGDRQRATTFLQRLFAECPDLLAHHAGAILLAHLLRWMPQDFSAGMLATLRNRSDAFSLQVAGEVDVVWAWVVEERDTPLERLDPAQTTAHERIGIALAAGRLWTEPRFSRRATDLLALALVDPDLGVRRAALDAFRTGDDFAWTNEARELLKIVINDASLLVEIHESVCGKMKSLLVLDPNIVLRFANAFLDAATTMRKEGWWAASAGPELTTLAVTLQRMRAHRDAGMDLFERLLAMGVYGVDQMLFDLDSRPRQLVSRETANSRRFARRRRAR